LQGEDRDIAIISALLHDIGKIRTHTPDRQLTHIGKTIRHKHITLEVLAQPLAWLDSGG
jgi:3'-5' exoribonuclease